MKIHDERLGLVYTGFRKWILTFLYLGFRENNMTFALKDFSDSTAHFNDCLKFALGRIEAGKTKEANKAKIEDIPSPRREQLQFLIAVHNELQTRIKNAKIEDLPVAKRQAALEPFSNIFYGAICVVTTDISNHQSRLGKGSKILERLYNTMGITAENQPSPAQYLNFYQHFNRFLNHLYLEEDSSNGFNKKNVFKSIPLDKLVKFANLSYKLEETTQNTVHAQLCEHGKTPAEYIKVSKVIPASAITPFQSWEELKESLHSLIITEETDKNQPSILQIVKSRSIQLQFLQTIAESLSSKKATNYKEADKIAILAGAMYLVRGQIAKEYRKEPLSHDDIAPTTFQYGSKVHTILTSILHAKEENLENTELLLSAMNQYLRHMGIEMNDGLKDSKDALRTKTIFSEIKGLEFVSFLNLTQEMIRSCRVGILNRCVIDLKKELELDKPSSKTAGVSYFPSLGGWFSNKPVKKNSGYETDEDEDDEEDQHSCHEEKGEGSTAHP